MKKTLMPLLSLFALLSASFGFAQAPDSDVHITLGEGDRLMKVTAEPGALRLSTGREVTEVPDVLQGKPAVISGRGKGDQPGPAYTFSVDKPVAVYIAVFNRANYRPPAEWKYTGLSLGWEIYQDPIYVKAFPAGEVSIPPHDGQAGSYGPPHFTVVSTDMQSARDLVSKAPAAYTPKRPEQPGFFMFESVESDHTGGYLEIDKPHKFRFRIRGGNAERDPEEVRLVVKETSGDFRFEARSAISAERITETFEITLPRLGFYEMTLEFDEEAFVRAYVSGLAVAPQPEAPDRESPWGVMKAGNRANEAEMARRLGVSWIRHSLWLAAEPTEIVAGPEPKVEVNMKQYLDKAREYKDEGIYVLSGFQWIPRVMSSRPDDQSRSAKSWDAGPKYLRVPPADYGVWKAYIREIVRQSQGLVDAWEVGNEPNMPDSYWGGTTDEFAEWFNHTVEAILEVEPDALIVGPGFTLEHTALPFFRRMLELGNGEHLDVVSVHSLYGKQVSVNEIKKIMDEFGIGDLPIWSTEPKHAIPLRNFNEGIAVNTHFLLFPPGADFYEQFENLSRGDMSATRAGLAYAVGARIIGKAKALEPPAIAVPDVELALFEREGKQILAIQADKGPLGARLNVEVLGGGFYTDTLAQSTRLDSGTFQVPLDRSGFVHGARELRIGSLELPDRGEEDGFDVPITAARLRNGFGLRQNEDRGHWAVVYNTAGALPEAQRPEVVFPIELPEDGTYEFYVNNQWMANLYKQLTAPLEWSLDGQTYYPVNETSAHWRKSTREHMRFGPVENPGSETIQHVDMMCRIGSMRRLRAGKHQLYLRLAAPRQHDNAWSAEIGGLTFRQIPDDME